MKKGILYIGTLTFMAGVILAISGCNQNFEEYNQDPFAITEKDLEGDYRLVGEPFVNMIRNIYVHNPTWVTQLQQNLIGDVYAGYMMPPTPFAGNSNNMNYNLVDGWNTWAWNPTYNDVMAPTLFVEDKAGDDFPEFIAWSKIVKVAAMHRLTDIFGPVIYTQYGNVEKDGTIAYDCQDVVYDNFFKDLDDGVKGIEEYKNNNSGEPFTQFDEVYGGDMTKWIQLANSLRLRLAVRVSKVDPARAQTEAEKAMNHPGGVITSNDGNFTIKNDVAHPLNTINGAWNDVRMGAPMESILKGFNDPRIGAYFKVSDKTGDYQGIRQGIVIEDKGDYVGFSALQDLGDVQLMTAAEVYFLRAEGALWGWSNMGGSAQDLYEMGVTTSFEQHGLGGVSDYLADDTSTSVPYSDPQNNDNNVGAGSPHLSTITVAWEGDGNELERIITQKWIAMYPDGQEAWSEYRRTGFPVLFPVVINNSGGEVDTEAQIKRVKYISGEYAQNPNGVQMGVNCLDGSDTGGTALWWDVD